MNNKNLNNEYDEEEIDNLDRINEFGINVTEYKIVLNDLNEPTTEIVDTYQIGLPEEQLERHDFLPQKDAAGYLLSEEVGLGKSFDERVYVLANSLDGTIRLCEVAHGHVCGTMENFRNIFTFLMLIGARTFSIIHNHPGGYVKASKADFVFVEKIKLMSSIFEKLEFKECLIVGGNCTHYNNIINGKDDIYDWTTGETGE